MSWGRAKKAPLKYLACSGPSSVSFSRGYDGDVRPGLGRGRGRQQQGQPRCRKDRGRGRGRRGGGGLARRPESESERERAPPPRRESESRGGGGRERGAEAKSQAGRVELLACCGQGLPVCWAVILSWWAIGLPGLLMCFFKEKLQFISSTITEVSFFPSTLKLNINLKKTLKLDITPP